MDCRHSKSSLFGGFKSAQPQWRLRRIREQAVVPLQAEMYSRAISATPRLARRAWWKSRRCFSSSCSWEGKSEIVQICASERRNFFDSESKHREGLFKTLSQLHYCYWFFQYVYDWGHSLGQDYFSSFIMAHSYFFWLSVLTQLHTDTYFSVAFILI